MVPASAPLIPLPVFYVDCPFIFALKHKYDHVPFFYGRVQSLPKSEMVMEKFNYFEMED